MVRLGMDEFYLNVVGYKGLHQTSSGIWDRRFYLNVVGYKVMFKDEEKRLTGFRFI